MSGVNKVILLGNLGQNPELKYTSSGVPFCNLSIATNERLGKDDAGKPKDHTEWHRVTAWRKLAEICAQYLSKGKQVYIEGRLRTRQWTTAEGEKRYTTEIVMDEMVMLGGRGDQGGGHGASTPHYDAYDPGEGFGGNRQPAGTSSYGPPAAAQSFPQPTPYQEPPLQAPPAVIDLDAIADDSFF